MPTKEILPLRPGYGTRGDKVILYANYFELLPNPNLVLYRYNVAVQPSAQGKKLSQIIRLLLELPEFVELRDDIVTDYKSTLICRKKIGPDTVESAIQYRAEGEDEPTAYALSYRIRVQETGILTVSQLTDHLTSSSATSIFSETKPLLQALNIFLGHYTKSSPTIATVGSSKAFDITQGSPKLDLGAGLTAIRGFFTSVRVATCRILVNVNVSNGVFYDAIPLDQLIQRWNNANRSSPQSKLASFLKKVRVRVTHLPDKKNKAGQIIPRIKTISGLATPNDGRGNDHPPRVGKFGAGSKEVEFFYDNSSAGPSNAPAGQATGNGGAKQQGKGKKGGASNSGPGQGGAQARYISVYEFFSRGTWFISTQSRFSNYLSSPSASD